MSYTHLGDAQLSYVAGMDPVVDPSGVPGQILGSGTGVIEGPYLKGTLRWSFFEEECSWDAGLVLRDAPPAPDGGRSVCRTYPRGIIETADGEVIGFEGQGFALRRADDPIWLVASTVRFLTEAHQHRWLTDVLGAYAGTFDERRGTATWSFHAPAGAVPGD